MRFDANVGPGLSWEFLPKQPTMEVRLGESAMAYYKVTNRSTKATVGSATFNVTPDQMGSYFNKVQCFCFTEQRLEPGETVEMPVTFFIDAAMLKDGDVAEAHDVTLSYTFYSVEHPKQSAAPAPDTGGVCKGS